MEKKEFVLGTWQQQEWRWLVIVALFLTGTGSGLYLISLAAGYAMGMAIGLVFVLAGSCFLLIDLTRPQTAWRLVSRPQSSWMSRGVIGISSFTVLGFFHIVFLVSSPGGWGSLGAPWVSGPAGMMVLGFLSGLAALFVAAYPGFLLGNMRSISFWNSAYIPALFLVSALLGGFGVLYLLPLNWYGLPWLPSIKNIGLVLVVFELILLLGLTWLTLPGATCDSVSLLTRGSLRFHFFIGLIGLGLIVPLVLLGLISLGVGVVSFLLIEGVLHLIGVFLLRYLIIRAATHVSVH